MLRCILILALANTAFTLNCQSPKVNKREFRAVWVATIHNIDWPSKKGLSPEEQRQEFITLIDQHQQMGMNAIIVQIRASGDAFYQSAYEPWSEWLTGKQGQAPLPFYDPLEFMIEEAHKRGMEFHAWINPFRGVSHTRFSSVTDKHISRQRPDWFFQHKNTIYFNPGIPQVRNYLTRVVSDIVSCYDVDGIHFDDYFYPYRKLGETIADWDTYRVYGQAYDHISDWRRANIDQFIHQVSDSIRAIKPLVKFGISPIGIWRNKQDDSSGSNTTSFSSYDMAYADVRKWLEKGWLDYVAPQLYWSTSHPGANYTELLNWWSENSFGRHVYIGHAMFKVKKNIAKRWHNPGELPRQIEMRRHSANVQGGIFYSASSFKGNPHEIEELLQNNFHRHTALIPTMPWKDDIPPLAPWSAEISYHSDKPILTWRAPIPAADEQEAAQYIVYGFPPGHEVDIRYPAFIRSIQPDTTFIDPEGMQAQGYHYAITAMDRLKNESKTFALVPAHPIKTIAIEQFATPPILHKGKNIKSRMGLEMLK